MAGSAKRLNSFFQITYMKYQYFERGDELGSKINHKLVTLSF